MKYAQPPEVLKLVAKGPCRALGPLRLVPHTLFYALSSIPMPWQAEKYVDVVYHCDGSISFVVDRYKISERAYRKRWSYVKDTARGRVRVEQLDRVASDFTSKPAAEQNSDPTQSGRIEQGRDSAGHRLFTAVREDLDGRDAGAPIQSRAVGRSPSRTALQGKARNVFDAAARRASDRIHRSASTELQSYLYGPSNKVRRPLDIVLYKKESTLKRISSRRARRNSKGERRFQRPGIVKELYKSEHFEKTEMEWTDAVLVALEQIRGLIRRLLYVKKLSYMSIDDNFNIYPNRALATKERKRSRLGLSVRLVADMAKLLKYVCDAFAEHRRGGMSAGDLCCSLKYIFCNVGILTGMYRYKYKIARQIKLAKQLPRNDSVWAPQWRVWCAMYRGYIPFLERCLSNLVDRVENGRAARDLKSTVQRVDSNFDIAIKRQLKAEVGANPRVLQHFNERWRCWKADVPYRIAQEADCSEADIERANQLIEKYCALKAEQYIREATAPLKKKKVDRRRQISKVLRLYLKNERVRQLNYLASPSLKVEHAVAIYASMRRYIGDRRAAGDALRVCFPQEVDAGMLKGALGRLKRHCSRDEAELIDSACSTELAARIRKDLICKRTFQSIEVRMKADTRYTCYYKVDIEERITDAYLDTYLWYEADRQGLFPPHFRLKDTSEAEIAQELCARAAASGGGLYHFEYHGLLKRIDLTLLGKLLKLVVDPILVDYMVSRLSCKLTYKDMELTNAFGVISGLELSSFICAFWLLVLDLVAFRPGAVLLLYNQSFYMLGPGDEGKDEFITGVRTRLPPSCGCIGFVSVSFQPHAFRVGDLSVQMARESSPNAFVIARVSGEYRYARISVDQSARHAFCIQTRGLVHRSTGSSFIRLVQRWNALVLEHVARFREALDLQPLQECEEKVKTAIKKAINSRMPRRFPPMLFYAPTELGGLGMLNICPVRGDGPVLPSITEHFRSWGDLMARGDPTDHAGSFDRDSKVLKCQSFRNALAGHTTLKTPRRYGPAFFKYLSSERTDVAACFGGADRILEHTLFRSLNVLKVESLQAIWAAPDCRVSTRAQKQGLSTIPNRRFVLWWSPVLNRARVYMGYQEQLAPTGVVMHGKLSNLKTFFVQIFRGRLWQHIHEDAVAAVGTILGEWAVIKNQVSRKKSFCNTGEFDLTIQGEICIDGPCAEQHNSVTLSCVNIDVALCWGDYDTRDTARLAQRRYSSYTTAQHALVVVLDVCYLQYAVHGCCSEELRQSIIEALQRFGEQNTSMRILRERLRLALSLSLPDSIATAAELFSIGAICEVCGDSVFVLNLRNGNLYWRAAERLQSVAPLLSGRRFDEQTCGRSGGVKDRAAIAILRLVEEMGAREFAAPTDMMAHFARYATDFPGIVAKACSEVLDLHSFKACLPSGGLSAVQNVYFPAASRHTSFYRLSLLLKAIGACPQSVKDLQLAYPESWTEWAEGRWAEVERALKSICGVNSDDAQAWTAAQNYCNADSYWVEDYQKQTERGKQGRIFAPLGSESAHFHPTRALVTARSCTSLAEELSEARLPAAGSQTMSLNEAIEQIVGSELIQIPANVIAQFLLAATTDRAVRAYILQLRPFTVALLPQYLGTFVEPPGIVGVLTNAAFDYKAGLQVLAGKDLAVRRWMGNAFVKYAHKIVAEHGIFLTTDWNFNFRADLFKREYALDEQTVASYYDKRHRMRHFQKFEIDVSRLNKH
ncbi:pre-mRNA-processing factor 8 [Pancytospora philotis]|nr:pre-mRNA-processing factor 8 [Pancytospora philotis]